ncbi:MAG: binding-protein-dependent transport system inner rane component [Herbinix sp.]|jgi:multiple sugar transport system permease protein|nr:binding-protein-dependent transport system inner rane component [Herbinix sp.]
MFFDKYSKKEDGTIRFYDLHSMRTRVLCIIIFLICIVVIIVALFPPAWVFMAGFRTLKDFNNIPAILPEKFDFSLFAKTWNDLKFTKYYINSFYVLFGSILSAIFFNGLLAYALAILKPKGHKIVFGLVLWSMLIPATTSMVALFVNISKMGLSQSFIPLWLMIGANAFFVILFKQFFESLPKELIEAAKLDGCGYLQTFLRIVLPLSKSIVMVIIIFAINAAWSDFLLPYLLLNNSGKETVMVRLYMFQGGTATSVELLRAVVFSIIPPIFLFIIFQKQITQGAAAGALKG